jgi:hypothetical protein
MRGATVEKAARVNLLACAATLAAYGAVFLVQPAVLGGLVGLELTSPDAPVEIRAFYGGLELGMAAFLLACAHNRSLVSAGLLFCALAFSFAGIARLLGVLQYGAAGPAHVIVGAVELSGAALSTWLRIRLAGAPAAARIGTLA